MWGVRKALGWTYGGKDRLKECKNRRQQGGGKKRRHHEKKDGDHIKLCLIV